MPSPGLQARTVAQIPTSAPALRLRGSPFHPAPGGMGAGHPMTHHSPGTPKVSPTSAKGKKTLDAMFEEVHRDEPEIVTKTRKKKGKAAAERQRIAIALSKARRAGVAVAKKKGR